MSADGQAVRAELQEMFRTVLVAPDFVLTDDMVTGMHPSWNSIANVEILLSCEERWDFEFSSAEIDKIRSFGDLADAVVAKLG